LPVKFKEARSTFLDLNKQIEKGNTKTDLTQKLDNVFFEFSTLCNASPGNISPIFIILDNPEYLFWRGRCYFSKEIIERALYDFSAAILKGKNKDYKPFQVETMWEAYLFAG